MSAPGSGDATLSTCGIGTTYVAAGSSVVVTCGSIQVQVVTGAARVVVGGGTVVVDVPAGVTAKVADLGGGNFSVENLGGGDVTVTNNGVASLVPAGETGSIDTTPPTIAPLRDGIARDERLVSQRRERVVVGRRSRLGGGHDRVWHFHREHGHPRCLVHLSGDQWRRFGILDGRRHT